MPRDRNSPPQKADKMNQGGFLPITLLLAISSSQKHTRTAKLTQRNQIDYTTEQIICVRKILSKTEFSDCYSDFLSYNRCLRILKYHLEKHLNTNDLHGRLYSLEHNIQSLILKINEK